MHLARCSMAPGRPSLREVVLKTTVAHTVTYFLVGLAAFSLFDYAHKLLSRVCAR
jgi:hypothetical protein